MIIPICQYLGAVMGLIGAALVSSRVASRRRSGFACWIVSNLCLVLFFVDSQAWPLLGMQSVYLITSVIGWRNNR